MNISNLLFCASMGLVPLLASEETRPNIVFLMSDDQNFGSMGCYGNSDAKTPNLDKLAADGVTFDKHYTSTAICMASRATVMTGKYEYKSGCNFGHGNMLTSTWSESYPVLLRKSGYYTAFAGKFGFELKEKPKSKSVGMPVSDFDVWGGAEGQSEYETAKNTSMKKYAKEFPHATLSYGAFGRDFIESASKQNKPFCLSISFKAPHRPTTPDPKFNAIYKGKVFKKPANYGRDKGQHFSKQSQTGRQYERFTSWEYDKAYDSVMATYHQQVYGIDVAFGMVREALEKHGVADNTVIIYTSDNGFLCGSHGYGSKVLPYEESSRVPLIIFDPRSKKSGQSIRSSALTCNIDFAPTMLELAGIKPPTDMDGKNLMDVYEKPDMELHESIALMNMWGPPATHALSVVTKDYKYINWSYAGEGFEVAEELYDLKEDSIEMHNIVRSSPDQSATIEKMRALYDVHVKKWANESVDYNHYKEYATIFDRSIPWAQKMKLYAKTRLK